MKISKSTIKRLRIGFGILIIILSCLLALRPTDIKLNDYKEVEIVLQKKPVFNQYSVRGAIYKEIHLYSIDNNCKFNISGFRFKSLKINKDDFIENFKQFDTVNILISKSDYYTLKKYKKIRNDFSVYNVRQKDFNYIDLNRYNQLIRKDNNTILLLSIIGLILIIYGLAADIYVAHIITGFIVFIIIVLEFIYIDSKW